MKVELGHDDLCEIICTLEAKGRAEASPRSLLLAAQLMEKLGLFATAAATKDEARRLQDARVRNEPGT